LHVVPQVPPALHALQLPAPSHTRPVPQLVPGAALLLGMQTGAPVVQLYVPGAQVVPQAAPVEQAAHPPLPSHTMPDPHVIPGPAFDCLHICVPELQS
jgi:hypothetical protein